MEEDEGVCLNAHRSSTKNRYPAGAGETHTRITNTAVNNRRIKYFTYYHGDRVTHTDCQTTTINIKNIEFTCLTTWLWPVV